MKRLKRGDKIKHKGKILTVLSLEFWRHHIVEGTLVVVSDGEGDVYDYNLLTKKRQIYQ